MAHDEALHSTRAAAPPIDAQQPRPAPARWPARRWWRNSFYKPGRGVGQVGADRAAKDLQRVRIEQLAAAGGAAARRSPARLAAAEVTNRCARFVR
ncbi:hypothetical protein ACHMW6_00115 (plasmid) [Pseudoduganella sp. UC29_106]|uniref:hypothetical protein n=1 Tax=Pseudoduganella sp. UC29_106 TaxID=3374553 RepID=UPI003757B5FF